MDLSICEFLSPVTKDLVHRFLQSRETDGSLCFGMIQALKKEAESHIKSQTFLYAEYCYKFALQSIVNLRQKTSLEVISSHDEAILWSNISFVKCKQKKYQEAFQDALFSIQLDQGYSKGYWRASQAKCGLNNFTEAATYLLHFLACVQPTDDDFVHFMSEVAILIPQIQSMNTRPPGMNTRPPGMNTRPPGMNTRPPGMNTRPPGMNTRPPGMNTRPPGMNTRPPGKIGWDV
ncbi:hypothetical protein Btru_009654 [Bulinus truncatus]|nr:hypothetical protein Btru_009654 [Bulinus truncatus]